ncbi:hypothetical protein ABIB58_002829 [Brevundimonas sp. UYEF29]|uniref:hypothetical protein n=1 Tax=Brevundimonas sp. UYEF29 TaxID=3156346 RepID=UPI003397994F
MTQAPTPGPLTAAIDMLSDARDFIDRFSDVIDGDYGTSEPNAAMVMVHEINATIDHLSAPTAPVEASGSERENLKAALQRSKGWPHDLHPGPAADAAIAALHPQTSGETREHGPKCWGKTSASDEMAHCYCGSTDLRPQPSGETREAVRLALEDADALDRVSEEADDNQWQDWAATMRQAASRIHRLALLSTSPLALGGQQGDSETLRVLLDNLVIAQTLSKDIRQKATDEACSYLYDRRTTPARAEAQDEGAAGDSAIALARRCTQTIAAQHGPDSDFANGARMVLAALICAPSAHPSPTPAACISESALSHLIAEGDVRYVNENDVPTSAEDNRAWASFIAKHVLRHVTPAADADVKALLDDLSKGKLGRKEGDPVRNEFDRHIQTVQRLAAAADADRVRIAVEAFLKAEDEARDRLREAGTPLPSTPEVDALREALAALESTAAKEGGE